MVDAKEIARYMMETGVKETSAGDIPGATR